MNWYDETSYQSQNWYSSTFLVHRFSDIGRAKGSSKEWNNINDSGCHFTCLSMIIGINPAYLASVLRSYKKHYLVSTELTPLTGLNSVLTKLSSTGGKEIRLITCWKLSYSFPPDPLSLSWCLHYFLSDKTIPSVTINSKEDTSLVWDKNRPSEVGDKIIVRNVYISKKGNCNVCIELFDVGESSSIDEIGSWIKNKRKEGLHIICGPESHSFLVAGVDAKKEMVTWDPDISDMDSSEVRRMIKNGIPLADIMSKYKISKSNKLQMLAYRVQEKCENNS